jgi:hypothetical protein
MINADRTELRIPRVLAWLCSLFDNVLSDYQAGKADKVYGGGDERDSRGAFQDELIEQQSQRTQDDKDKAGALDTVFHNQGL